MNSYSQTQPDKDPKLWEIAQRRASFRYHFAVYLVINAFFWILWYFTDRDEIDQDWPWPIWPMIGWGIGVAFHYLGAYVFTKDNSVEREYDKLIKEREKHQ
jgi:hypothetical protein